MWWPISKNRGVCTLSSEDDISFIGCKLKQLLNFYKKILSKIHKSPQQKIYVNIFKPIQSSKGETQQFTRITDWMKIEKQCNFLGSGLKSEILGAFMIGSTNFTTNLSLLWDIL